MTMKTSEIEVCSDEPVKIEKADSHDLLDALSDIIDSDLTAYLGHEDAEERADNIISELRKRL